MTIYANGAVHQVQGSCTVADLLQEFGWKATQVVVELNGKVLVREATAQVSLHEGDKLEIVIPVAGG